MMTKTNTKHDSTMTSRERLLCALRGDPVDRPPIWFMRQAGRHLPGYRTIREKASFLDICRREDVNAPASAEPVFRYDIDAAIVFNDILIPLIDAGMSLDFLPAPKFERLIKTASDVRSLHIPRYDEKTDVARCLGALRREIGSDRAMLGFVGAPFTVASFAIGANKLPLSILVNEHLATFEALQDFLVPVLTDYAVAQVEAGADAIQIFESHAEKLSAQIFRHVGLPFLKEIVESITCRVPTTPILLFGRGLWPYIDDLAALGVTLSLDHAKPLAHARQHLRNAELRNSLQGNLDPDTLLTSKDNAVAAAGQLLSQWESICSRPEDVATYGPTGWVFNLGHGVPAKTDPNVIEAVVAAVKGFNFASQGKTGVKKS